MAAGFTGALLAGSFLGLVIGWLGWRWGALTGRGAAAAALLGALIFAFGGWQASLVMVIFFASSSLLTRFQKHRKAALQLAFGKVGRRDAWQVSANGGLAAALIVLSALTNSALPMAGFVGSLAAAAADTWATEIGVLSRNHPRSLLSRRQMARGASGGVTLLGYVAAAAGALALGMAGLLVVTRTGIVLIAFLAGLAGATADSILGERWQARYFCPACRLETESDTVHRCGQATKYAGGQRWLNNDVVNFLATGIGAGVAVGLAWWWL